METYLLERSGGGMMDGVIVAAWGGDAGSTEPATDSRAYAAETPCEEKEDREREKAHWEEMAAAAQTSSCRRNRKRQAATDHRRAEAKEQPETAQVNTLTCESYANITLLHCEAIVNIGINHTNMNASVMEPDTAEAVPTRPMGSVFMKLSWRYLDMLPANAIPGWDSVPRDITAITEPTATSICAFHVPEFIEMLEEKQSTGVGWLLENLDTSGNDRPDVYEKYVKKIIESVPVIGEAGCGADHHLV
eukprot:jgi/Tetstr1/447090/TSEL_034528.t1